MARKRGTPQHVENAKQTTWKIRRRADAMAKATPGTKSDRELIDEAIAAGKITKCPDAYAMGALTWPKPDKMGGT